MSEVEIIAHPFTRGVGTKKIDHLKSWLLDEKEKDFWELQL